MGNDNIFDNTVVVTRSLEGQATPPADVVDPNATPPDGQVASPVTPAPAAPDAVTPPADDWKTQFQTPEEMYEAFKKVNTSYDNLRPAYTKVTQELSTMKRGATPPTVPPIQVVNTPPVQPVQQIPQAQQPTPMSPVDLMAGIASQQIAPLVEKVDMLTMENKVMKMAQDNPDFKQLAPKVVEIMQQRPALWQLPDALDVALDLARQAASRENMGQIVQGIKDDMYADKELRVLGGGTPPVNVSQAAGSKTAEQEIREGIMNASKANRGVF